MSSESEKEEVLPSQKDEKEIEMPAPKYKLKKLIPKREDDSISEKERARREKLSQQFKERHAKSRAEKERYEKEQLEKIAKKINVKVKAKQVKEKIKEYESETETDEETLNEYLEFKKFKAQKKKPVCPSGANSYGRAKEEVANHADDEIDSKKIVEKAKKADQVLQAVSKLDQTINSLNGGYTNPYLALFNSKK